ncbi:single-stranded DNA-binding protein [Clostridium perfringens]|uniref:single-stranded DNA-binding protein n=1 Tax=Clostridium perfringens TaxID=1502 RepID=UPI00232B3CF5|nr:single-stranded DNA-binding protein [Clostridium perfringens]MDB2049612.1 single-stranded DNA-binding protein [Clostridium perfringens]
MNTVILVGRLTKDPEMRFIPGFGTPVARFTVAVNRDFKNKEGKVDTDFIICEAMGKTADFVGNYLTKGRQVSILGTIRVDRYMENDSDVPKTFTKVMVKNINALDSRKKDDAPTPPRGLDPQGFQAIYDDEIPF